MQKKLLLALGMSLTAATVTFAGENLVKNGDFSQGGANWATLAQYNKVDQTFTLTAARHTMISKEAIKVDPNAKYKITVKLAAQGQRALFCGVIPLDKDGKQILTRHVGVVRGTDSVLLKDAPAGSDTLLVKANPRWKLYRYTNIAFNTKPDNSDLPNYDVAAVAAVTPQADGVEVKLRSPLAKAYAANTHVRLHQDGATYIYAVRFPKDVSQAAEYTGEVGKGTRDSFRPGTVGVKMYLFMNADRANKDAKTVVESIKFEKVDAAAK